MFIAEVIAPVVSTIKHPFFNGRKLLLVKEKKKDGTLGKKVYVALDAAQANIGDEVLVCKNGSAVDCVVREQQAPANVIVVGIIDKIEMGSNIG